MPWVSCLIARVGLKVWTIQLNQFSIFSFFSFLKILNVIFYVGKHLTSATCLIIAKVEPLVNCKLQGENYLHNSFLGELKKQ